MDLCFMHRLNPIDWKIRKILLFHIYHLPATRILFGLEETWQA